MTHIQNNQWRTAAICWPRSKSKPANEMTQNQNNQRRTIAICWPRCCIKRIVTG